MWVACAITTIGLVALTWVALKERYYSAVMAATGLLYLAILTAFGTDLVARASCVPICVLTRGARQDAFAVRQRSTWPRGARR